MRASTSLQNKIMVRLGEYFPEVVKEWDISKNATDAFSRNLGIYAPRPDVSVGPFNIERGNKINEIRKIFNDLAPSKLKQHVRMLGLHENENPRCTLAIEVVYSGSSKHMLGDITNASMMGLYGFVIASNSTFNTLERILKYVNAVKHVHKAPDSILSNVCVIKDADFLRLLQTE